MLFRSRSIAGGPTMLEVEIGNYSPTAQRLTAEVSLGSAAFRLEGLCPAGRRTTLAQEIQIPEVGWQIGSSQLVGVEDALAADNVRDFVVDVQGKPKYAVLTRQPAHERPSSSYFLQRGLVPDSLSGEGASASVVHVDATDIDRTALAAADLIVIDHPGKIAAADLNFLMGLVRRGRAIL